MQTFLPYPNFSQTAKVLDIKRLGKQRVETLQLMKAILLDTGWRNHPAAKMWKGYESALLRYQVVICLEWKSRGYKDTCLEKTTDLYFAHSQQVLASTTQFPEWFGDEAFHASHRSNLLRKNKEWYNQFHWSEPDSLPYVWPIKPS